MSRKTKTTDAPPAAIPAVAYIRMSTDDQEESPQQQRDEIARYAAEHGYEILREYIDEGISGDATKKRKAFLRMHTEGKSGKADFEVILCWHTDRFGRFDSIEGGYWIYPLRDAGIRLVTVQEGEQDWHSFSGKLITAIGTESNHQHNPKLSANVLRSHVALARKGRALFCTAYGYDRLYLDAAGKPAFRAVNGQRFRCGTDGWTCQWVPSEKAEQVETVRWLFREFVRADRSIMGLARALNARGVRTGRGNPWDPSAVRTILENSMYVGRYEYGKQPTGKYHRVGAEGKIEPRTSRKSRDRNPPVIVIEDHHEALIDRETFDAVQEKLAIRRREHRRPHSNGYPLSGSLRCSECGGLLGGAKHCSQGHWYRYYSCIKSTRGLCKSRHIRADLIEKLVADFVREWFDGPEGAQRINREALRMELAAQAARNDKQQPGRLQELKQQLARVEKQIGQVTRNLLLADAETLLAGQKLLDELRCQRDTIRADLEAVAGSEHVPQKAVDFLAARARGELARLHERLTCADSGVAREAAKQLFESITVYWHPRINRRNYVLDKVLFVTKNIPALGEMATQIPHILQLTALDRSEALAQVTKAVGVLSNGHPAKSLAVARLLRLTYGAAYQRLKDAAAKGLIQGDGRKGWFPADATA